MTRAPAPLFGSPTGEGSGRAGEELRRFMSAITCAVTALANGGMVLVVRRNPRPRSAGRTRAVIARAMAWRSLRHPLQFVPLFLHCEEWTMTVHDTFPGSPGALRWPTLFSPLRIGRRTVLNRFVSTPHATGWGHGGLLTRREVEYHVRKAAGIPAW